MIRFVYIVLFICLMVCAQAVEPVRTQKRGFTVSDLEEESLAVIASDWKCNLVRYMVRPSFLGKHKWHCSRREAWQRFLKTLPEGLDAAAKYGLTVVIDLHDIPNDRHDNYPDGKKERAAAFWDDESNLELLKKCWQDIAGICVDREQDIWFDLFNEPLNWNEMPDFPAKWPVWAQETINSIREIDRRHPVVVQPGPGGLCGGFKTFPLLKDDNIIYSLHQYWPHVYTHQGIGSTKNTDLARTYRYEGLGWPNKEQNWNRQRLVKSMQCVADFQKKHGVRIFVGEFSAVRWAPGAENYLRDCLEIFEENGWDWAYHAWRESYIWSLEHDDNFQKATVSKKRTKRNLIIREYMERNQQGGHKKQ